jgi:hypothetical protein
MKLHFFVMACGAGLLCGCSFFGYYQYERAVRLSSVGTGEVDYPDSYKSGLHMDGQMTRALAIAMNDYQPPGSRFKGDDKRIARCLSQWENYDISVLKVSDNLFFVEFAPNLPRCGIEEIVLDAGAEYAIDGHGRILDIH